MFDDPQAKLKWMEEALLEEEFPKPAPVLREEAAPLDDDDELMRRVDALLSDEPYPFAPQPYVPNPAPEPPPAVYTNSIYDKAAAAAPAPKQKGIGGLVLLALAELAAIVAVAGWWQRWL